MRHHHLFSLLFSLALALAPTTVFAQHEEAGEVARATAPAYRLDVVLPSAGVGLFAAPASDFERPILVVSGDVRIVDRHGHGALVRLARDVTLGADTIAVDADYVYRARLVGDDRFGLGLDLQAGLTVATFWHRELGLPMGVAPGGNVGASLDLRVYGFVVSLATEYRLLLPQEAARNGGPTGPEHALTAMLGIGFGFWGT